MTRAFTEKKLVLATHNKGKVAEISNLLQPYGIEVISASGLGLPEPEETETSFAGNAMLKARAAAAASGLPVLADDSGLCVHAIGDRPGVYSADWAGPEKNFTAAMEQVNRELGDASERTAHFMSVLVLAWPDGESVTVEGRVDGDIVWPPRGAAGFGYDPIFAPVGDTRTFGEMDLEEKKKYSHRAQAFGKLVAAVFRGE